MGSKVPELREKRRALKLELQVLQTIAEWQARRWRACNRFIAFIGLGLVGFFGLIFSNCLADERPIFGVHFEVEELTPVDASNSKLRVAGKSIILPNAEIDEYILKASFSGDSKLVLTPAQYRTFIINSLGGGRSDLAALAFLFLVSNFPATDASELLAELKARELIIEFAKACLTSAGAAPSGTLPPGVLSALAVEVGARDPEWLRANAVGIVYRNSAEFKSAALDRLKYLISAGDLVAADGLCNLSDQLFGKDDESSLRLRAMLVRSTQLLKDVEQGNLERVFPILGSAPSSSDLDFLLPLIANAVHTKAQGLIESGHPEDAILLLVRIDFDRRTDRTHELLNSALGAIRPSETSPLMHQAVNQFIARLADKDERVRLAIVSALEQQISYLIGIGRLNDSEALIKRLAQLRPDPSRENDALRSKLAFAMLERGQEGSASAVLGAVKSGVPLLFTLKLAAYRIWNDSLLLLAVILVPITILVIVRGRHIKARLADLARAREVAEKILGSATLEEEESDDEESRPKGFTVLQKRNVISPSQHEYLQLLAVFGLEANAGLSDIKRAYRQAVKSCHPDSQGAKDAKASQQFISYTKNYERLLELRAAQGLDQ